MRGDGRVMGGMKIIPPVLKPLCTKAIPAMTGELEIFFDVREMMASNSPTTKQAETSDAPLVPIKPGIPKEMLSCEATP